MSWVLLLSLICSGPRFDLTRYDIFNFNHVQFFKLPGANGLLIQAKLDNRLVVVDFDTGAITHQLSAAGHGPGELDMPTVLGVLDDHFIVSMNDGRIMAFDFSLNLLAKEYRKLALNLLGGHRYGGMFWIWLIPTTGFHLAEVSLEGGEWRVDRKLFDAKLDKRMRSDYWFGYQTGAAFKRQYDEGEDHYHIEALDHPFDEVTMILERPVDGLPGFDQSRVFINSCFRNVERYYVSIVLTDQHYNRTGSWVDEWTQDGTFITRHAVPLDTSLTCILNDDDVLAFSQPFPACAVVLIENTSKVENSCFDYQIASSLAFAAIKWGGPSGFSLSIRLFIRPSCFRD